MIFLLGREMDVEVKSGERRFMERCIILISFKPIINKSWWWTDIKKSTRKGKKNVINLRTVLPRR